MDFPLLNRWLAKRAEYLTTQQNPAELTQVQQLQQLLQSTLAPAKPNPGVNQQQFDNNQNSDAAVDGDVQVMNHQKQPQDDQASALLCKSLPELDKPSPTQELSSFGKVSCLKALKNKLNKQASAFVRDVCVKDLPADVQKDVYRFIPKDDKLKVIQYGAVVSDLLPKVDSKNWESAKAHSKGFKDKDAFYKKAPNKYILIVNDTIVDGHHFLAKAQAIGATNSLNVLDLTPVRFQKQSNDLLADVGDVASKGTNSVKFPNLLSYLSVNKPAILDNIKPEVLDFKDSWGLRQLAPEPNSLAGILRSRVEGFKTPLQMTNSRLKDNMVDLRRVFSGNKTFAQRLNDLYTNQPAWKQQ